MKFVGGAWKILVGIKDALVLIVLIVFFGAIYGALTASPYRGSASEGALRLDLAGAIVEQPARQDPLAALRGGSVIRQYRLAEVVHALDAAATDRHIKAVALDLDIFTGGGQTALADVGAALDRGRRAGKRVVAYANGYSDDGYQLAAHADEVWLDPLGAVLIAGPGGTNLYARLLRRLGVAASVYRVGVSNRSSPTQNDMSRSAGSRQALADALWATGARRSASQAARPGRRLSPINPFLRPPAALGAGGAARQPGRPDRRPREFGSAWPNSPGAAATTRRAIRRVISAPV